MKSELLKKIADREIVAGVVGLGYVGLPLAVEKAKAGFKTIGFDVQQSKVDQVNSGHNYIGDVVENAEEVAALLDLPPYTMPLSMLIIGTPRKERPAIAHPVVNLVHEERYRRADAATMDAQVAEMDAMFRPHAREVGERVVDIYTRKHTSPFMAEMSRSMEWWFKNWLGK